MVTAKEDSKTKTKVKDWTIHTLEVTRELNERG